MRNYTNEESREIAKDILTSCGFRPVIAEMRKQGRTSFLVIDSHTTSATTYTDGDEEYIFGEDHVIIRPFRLKRKGGYPGFFISLGDPTRIEEMDVIGYDELLNHLRENVIGINSDELD